MEDNYEKVDNFAQLKDQEALEFAKKLQQFQSLMSEMQREFSRSSDKEYYIVSSKFLREWKQFCSQTELRRALPSLMNEDIVDPTTNGLSQGLSEGQNFEIVNKRIYQLFNNFKSFQELRRISYGEVGEKRVPIRTEKLNYLTLTQKNLQQFDRKAKTRDHLKLKTIDSLCKQNSFQDFIQEVVKEELINSTKRTRIWRHSKETTLDAFFHHIIVSCKPQSYETMKIKSLGKLIEDTNIKIGDKYEDEDYFVIECIQHQKVAITAEDEGKCQKCYNYKKLTHACACKEVRYCSQECLKGDLNYHTPRCKVIQQQQMKKPIQMNMRQSSRRGLVGLENLGNTCFMNSCLQCLSHTLPLTQYFINQNYASEINLQNPIGTKGKLAQAYASFIKNMWCQEQRVFRPYRLKGAIAGVNKMFAGYAQHDSQQLFSFLVDGIHEDLNRVKVKPYVESVDSNDRPDDVVSRQSWLAYIKRNQSIISDTMVGQYKSKVTCPDCSKKSITFDPYITITLPIPEVSYTQMSLYVLTSDRQRETTKIRIKYKKKFFEQVFEEISKVLEKKVEDFLVYVLTMEENIYSFHTTPRSQLFHKIDTSSSYLFVVQLTQQQKALQSSSNKLQLTFRFSRKHYYSRYQAFWFKRPFFFDIQKVTGLDLVKRVLKYLYADIYKYSQKRIQLSKSKFRSDSTKPKLYQEYQEQMLTKRPFRILIRSNKKTKTTFSMNFQTQFDNEELIADDTLLKDVIDLEKLNDYEIDARFTEEGLQDFYYEKMKSYVEGKQSYHSKMDQQSKLVSLNDCFEALQNPEQLEKGNQWYCPQCKDFKLATKELEVYKTPQILIIHLKRFKVKGIIRKEKNETPIDFPLELDMSNYITNKEPINAYIPFVKSQNAYIQPSYTLKVPQAQVKPLYELFAISNHYGSLGGGHYTAYAKNGNNWYSFNDSSVSQVETDRIRGSGAYILFYRRKNS